MARKKNWERTMKLRIQPSLKQQERHSGELRRPLESLRTSVDEVVAVAQNNTSERHTLLVHSTPKITVIRKLRTSTLTDHVVMTTHIPGRDMQCFLTSFRRFHQLQLTQTIGSIINQIFSMVIFVCLRQYCLCKCTSI